jgi:hypothetical protein
VLTIKELDFWTSSGSASSASEIASREIPKMSGTRLQAAKEIWCIASDLAAREAQTETLKGNARVKKRKNACRTGLPM